MMEDIDVADSLVRCASQAQEQQEIANAVKCFQESDEAGDGSCAIPFDGDIYMLEETGERFQWKPTCLWRNDDSTIKVDRLCGLSRFPTTELTPDEKLAALGQYGYAVAVYRQGAEVEAQSAWADGRYRDWLTHRWHEFWGPPGVALSFTPRSPHCSAQ